MVAASDGLLIKILKPGAEQDPNQQSFLGGRPKLPRGAELPTCRNCGAIQTFFFQVAFPQEQPWEGESLAVFACTGCREEDQPVPAVNQTLIPSLKRMDLRRGEDVPDGALDLYQKVCRFLVFPTAEGVVRDDAAGRIRYRPIGLEPTTEAKPSRKSRVGGRPGWVDAVLTPGKYLGEPLTFLMQWRFGFEFERLPGSPPPYNPFAVELPGLTDDSTYYRLFEGTQLYFFGNHAGGRPHVFMVAVRG